MTQQHSRLQHTLRAVMRVSVLIALFTLAIPVAHAEVVRHPSKGHTLYPLNVKSAQLPDRFQMGTTIPPARAPVPPRAYWVSPVYSAATFAGGEWLLSVTVQVKTSPSFNTYSLVVVSATGDVLRDIGGPISRRYSTIGSQSDKISFPSQSVTLRNERVEVYYTVPNWCTPAVVRTGANTYLHIPTE